MKLSNKFTPTLVLEGGALRCAFTFGILDYFLEKSYSFPKVRGVSAGALAAYVFVSKQHGIFSTFPMEEISRLFSSQTDRGTLDMKQIGSVLRGSLSFTWENAKNSDTACEVGALNAKTAEMEYFSVAVQPTEVKWWDVLMASCAIPSLCEPVEFNGKDYYDGGMGDAIPFPKSQEPCIVILTQDRNYRKGTENQLWSDPRISEEYPQTLERLQHRKEEYEQQRSHVFEEEEKGNYFVFAPSFDADIDLFHSSAEEVGHLYQEGYRQAMSREGELLAWLEQEAS